MSPRGWLGPPKVGACYVADNRGLLRRIIGTTVERGEVCYMWQGFNSITGAATGDSHICSARTLAAWANRLATEEEVARLHEPPESSAHGVLDSVAFVAQVLATCPDQVLMAEVRRRRHFPDGRRPAPGPRQKRRGVGRAGKGSLRDGELAARYGLVQRGKFFYSTEDRRFVVTDLALLTSRRRGFRVSDTMAPTDEAVGFVKTLAAAGKLIARYLEAEQAGIKWPWPVRRPGLP